MLLMGDLLSAFARQAALAQFDVNPSIDAAAGVRGDVCSALTAAYLFEFRD